MKKLIGIIVIGLVSYSSWANEKADLINISTCEELQQMQNNAGGDYILTRDIDCSGTVNWNNGLGFNPIDNNPSGPFYGSFDGNGYKITGLTIKRGNQNYVGLFASISNATITSLFLEGVNIEGYNYVGGIAGSASGGSTITDSYVSGYVSGIFVAGGLIGLNTDSTVLNGYSAANVYGDQAVGGLVGANFTDGEVIRSYATSNVYGIDYVGGLVGRNEYATVTQSHAMGKVSGTNSLIGGLIGYSTEGIVTNSYARGAVSGSIDTGGLIGFSWQDNAITNCYSTGAVSGSSSLGGLLGYAYGSLISSSYWDTQTSGQQYSSGGTGKTTAQMFTQSTYVGWDFNNIWYWFDGEYPTLR